MWRCFYGLFTTIRPRKVCSTHVEMFLKLCTSHELSRRLLHACGDVSMLRVRKRMHLLFAPRMWRCFCDLRSSVYLIPVCSTHVEMFLNFIVLNCFRMSLLHACGDVSRNQLSHITVKLFAPRMWRCFPYGIPKVIATFVCSTHVEMFPEAAMTELHRVCLLHACGDVSAWVSSWISVRLFAPRMWSSFDIIN